MARRVTLGMALLIALGLVAWLLVAFVIDPGTTAPEDDAATAQRDTDLLESDRDADAPTLEGRGSGDEEGTRTAARLPPPVDLEAVDRARDLHGIVVRADGRPVAGAVLQVLTYPWRNAHVLGYEHYFESNAGPSTRSASDGTFALRLQAGDHVHLKATAEGFAPQELSMLQAGERVRIVLTPAVVLHVIARTPEGEPASDLEMRLFTTGSAEGPTINLQTTTDAAGRATFDSLPPNLQVRLDPRPRREGWGNPSWLRLQLPARGEMTYDLALPEGDTIRGRVTDAITSQPVSAARVGMGWPLIPDTRTDEDGRYELHGWTGKGRSEIHVLATGYGRAEADVGGRDVIDFALHPGGTVTGRVLGTDGKPRASALVAAVGSQRAGGRTQGLSMDSGLTDGEGRFTLSDLRRDVGHTLFVQVCGQARFLRDVGFSSEARTIDVGDLRLGRSRRLLGTVRMDDGAPAAGLRIDLRMAPITGPSYGRRWRRRTDDLGRFTFTDLAPGSYKLWTYPSAGPGTTHEVEVLDRDEPSTLDIQLAATTQLRVVVVDDQGKPVPDMLVYASGANARTDAEGVARLRVTNRGVNAGVGIREEDPYLVPGLVPVEPGQAEVRITLTRATFTTGKVAHEDGTPVAKGQVSAMANQRYVGTGMADDDGRFVLYVDGSLEKVRLTAYQHRPDGTFLNGGPLEARPGSTGLRITLKKPQ